MVNFPDPQVDVVTSAQVHVDIVKFWHAVGGLYIWEYFTTVQYEWKVIRRRLPYRWTIWVYSFSRFSALLSVILFFVTLNVTTSINCQLWTFFSVLFLCLASSTASLLIAIRTVAIWNRNKVAVALTMAVWCTSIGFHLYNIIRLHVKWAPSELACEPSSNDPTGLGFIPAVIADMALLLIILAGLFAMRRNSGVTFGLTRLLWKQGVIWLIISSAMEIPPIVFTLVHSNDPLQFLFEVPCLIVMIIAATRMHRSLVDFASGPTEIDENRPLSSLVFSKTKRTDTTATTLGRIRTSVNGAFEHHSTGSKNDGDSSTVFSTNEKLPQVAGDPSTLDLSQASEHPLPTVSPPSVLEAESV